MNRYTKYNLTQALEAVANGQSARKAALDWGIPKSTLQNRLYGHESHQQAAESQQRLSPVQEGHLTNWILVQEALGLPPTHAQIKEFAQRILAIKGDYEPLGKHWMQAFLKRNPVIRTKKHRSIDSCRVNGATTEVIKPWFQHLHLPEIQAIKPENRYNMDESGIIEGLGENGLVVGSSERRSIQKKQPGSKAWTSFIECISAAGFALTPLVIFKGKTVQQQWFPEDLSIFEGWQFTATENGWTTDATAVEWLKRVFIPLTMPKDPKEARLLVLDGHGSHETTEFMYLCYQHNIYLLFLPPHSSHVLQPLDLSVFSPLKSRYRKEIGYLNLLTDSSPIGKQNFLICYQKARKEALSAGNIKGGWKATGLWPRCMAKPLMSPLLLENSNNTKRTSNQQVEGQIGGHISDWTAESSLVTWSTPRKSVDLRSQIQTYHKLEEIDKPTCRQLFKKITKGFDEKDILLAKAELKIQALEARLEASRPKKRRKVKTSPNSKFADIEAIYKAQKEAIGVQTEMEESDASQ